ncbi:hypothetical protein [Sphingomonas cavernae]|uniref:Uncharacterized protein n=1 Tax=Sphingomonas cavernae TaxID=2320861 RepID=A0A418WJS2_9SPHN|nr:hypothetical protein [Sphingomonas cavernae]RJF90265.1 hypothetical protein D3876_08280 [Sphingomonas cavernae]
MQRRSSPGASLFDKRVARALGIGQHLRSFGGIVAPGGRRMDIGRIDDRLLIEARLSPLEIAFIHRRQQLMINVAVGDRSIHGTLAGRRSHVFRHDPE